ncbi:hypothetical protein LZ198_15235 [Myxococcus sp. K15C18031901]|uniref:hypothetical protein n=1 Tax=Myxococcus dinghuensis TaxID=2906761 RepID=UPI0020A7AD5F|nr:hypothetical protein [Myxococcus dinghuensis]MCP3100222.1 hypothetical protein [Myxococcus dinghuensis]
MLLSGIAVVAVAFGVLFFIRSPLDSRWFLVEVPRLLASGERAEAELLERQVTGLRVNNPQAGRWKTLSRTRCYPLSP